MKKKRVQDAIGETLCHDLTAILENGFKGVRFKRGHVISEEDIPVLLDMGKNHVFTWDPEVNEVHEEDAALEVVEAMVGKNVTFTVASEGKIGINADVDGLFVLNREGLRLINAVEDYTIATRKNNTLVSRGEKLCGARIVPLVTKRENVDQAVAHAKSHYPILEVLPYKPLKAAVIITGSEVYYGRIADKFEPIMRQKLEGYGAQILGVTKCPDDLEAIETAMADYKSKGVELLLLTGGMSVDPDDLTPTAIRSFCDVVLVQGVPMQPGNMLTIGLRGETTVIGVPGASMHSSITSLDVFLPRIFAGLSLKEEDFAAYGEGGLCMGCEVCRYPICYFGTR